MMERSDALSLLGLDDGFSPEALKVAYRRRLKTCGPDRDPQGFARLRQAYELLLGAGVAGPGAKPSPPPPPPAPPPTRRDQQPATPRRPASGGALEDAEEMLRAGRTESAVDRLLDAFRDAGGAARLRVGAPVLLVLGMLARREPVHAWRLLDGYRAWLEQYSLEARLYVEQKVMLQTLQAMRDLPGDFPAEVLAIIAEALLARDLFPLKARLHEYAQRDPSAARRARAALPEPDSLAEKLGFGPTPVFTMASVALHVADRAAIAAPLEAVLSQARSLIEPARTDDRRALAWRALHDLLQAQPAAAVEALVPFLETLLEDWPDELRATMCSSPWDTQVILGAPDPAHRLLRYLRHDSVFVGRDRRFRMRSPNLDPDDAQRLAASPIAAGLTQINLDGQSLGWKTGKVLAQSPNFRRLEVLSLSSCGLGTEGVVALAKGSFPRLRRVDLSYNGAGPAAAAAWAAFGPLQKLVLSRNPLGAASGVLGAAPVEMLELASCGVRADALGELGQRGIDLSENAIGADGVGRIRGPALKTLELAKCQLGDAGAAALGLAELEYLGLNENGITAAGTGRLRVETRRLALRKNPIGDAGLSALFGERRGLRELDARDCGIAAAELHGDLSRIEVLDLCDNPLHDLGWLSGAGELTELTVSGVRLDTAAAGWWPKLRSLTVFDCSPEDGALAAVPSQRLWLTGGRQGDSLLLALARRDSWRPEVMAIIADIPRPPRGQVTDEGVAALAGSPAASSLTELQLNGHPGITDEGALAICRSPYLANLERLHLRYCSIRDAGVLALLDRWPSLRLELEGNPLDARALAALKAQPPQCCP